MQVFRYKRDALFFFIRSAMLLCCIYYLGFILGTIVYLLYFRLQSAFMWQVFSMESLNNMDYCFFLDNPKNVANIVSVIYMDKKNSKGSLEDNLENYK